MNCFLSFKHNPLPSVRHIYYRCPVSIFSYSVNFSSAPYAEKGRSDRPSCWKMRSFRRPKTQLSRSFPCGTRKLLWSSELPRVISPAEYPTSYPQDQPPSYWDLADSGFWENAHLRRHEIFRGEIFRYCETYVFSVCARRISFVLCHAGYHLQRYR